MFGKVIVFGLFEMIQKKKKVRTASLGLGLASGVGLGQVRWHRPSHSRSGQVRHTTSPPSPHNAATLQCWRYHDLRHSEILQCNSTFT